MTTEDSNRQGTAWMRLRTKVEEGQLGGISDGAPALPKVDWIQTEGTGSGGRCQDCMIPVDDHPNIMYWDVLEPIAKTGCPDREGRYA